MSKNSDEKVNHPNHYNSHPSGIEAIELCRHFPFVEGNAIKYIWRAGLKPGSCALEDLKKAQWYLRRASRPEVSDEARAIVESLLASMSWKTCDIAHRMFSNMNNPCSVRNWVAKTLVDVNEEIEILRSLAEKEAT